MIPVEGGGGSIRCPVPQNGMMNNRNLPMDTNKNRYEKPVQTPFVTVMVDNPPVLKERALRVTGISTEMIPNMNLAGRREPVDWSGPVGPQSNTEQPVLLGLNTDERGNAPAGPVGPDVILAGRGVTVDRPGLVGSQNRTEQSVSD